jgi:hypothetical protein
MVSGCTHNTRAADAQASRLRALEIPRGSRHADPQCTAGRGSQNQFVRMEQTEDTDAEVFAAGGRVQRQQKKRDPAHASAVRQAE